MHRGRAGDRGGAGGALTRARPRLRAAVACAAIAAACDGEPGIGRWALPPVGIEEGSTAPALRGTTRAGEPYTLAREGDPVVLVFVRGGHCGFCRDRLRALQRSLALYRARGAEVLAVTAEAPATAERTRQITGATFPLVSVDTATLRRWGVLPRGVPPSPATYLLDHRRVILYRQVGANAADHAADSTLLRLLDQWRGAR